jgi:hypothetical protein
VETFSNGKDMGYCLAEEPNYKHGRGVDARVLKVVIVGWSGIGSGAGGSRTLIPNDFAIQRARKTEEIVEISRAARG